jgi:hypothetical protein
LAHAAAAAIIATTLLTCAGCRRGPVELTPIPAPRVERRSVVLENGLIALNLVLPFGSDGPKPTVIGLGEMDEALVDAGIVSLSYRIDWTTRQDAPLPMTPFAAGAGRWLLASPSPARLGERWARSIASVADIAIPRIVDYLEALPGVDRDRIVVAGTSTDGFVALQALARDHRLAGAIVVGACGDYHAFLRDSPLGMAGGPLELDPSYDAWLSSQEIVRRPERVVPAPLLLLNRVDDPVIPIACADETARVFGDAYAAVGASDRFQRQRLPGAAHGLGAEERAAVQRFLTRWLVR